LWNVWKTITRAARLHPLVHEFSNQLVPGAEQAGFRSAAAEKLTEVLFDYPRLEAEVRSQGVEAVIGDLDTGIEWWGQDAERLYELKILQGTLRLSAHVLVRDSRQLASQLTGRLLGIDDNDIQALLKQTAEKAPRPSLWPLRGNLTPPGGPLIRILEGHSNSVSGVAITPDGARAVSASGDKTLQIWDLESGQSLRTLEGHGDSVNGVAITPDGRRAVSASWDKTLRVWDLESGQSLRTLEGHSNSVNGVAITLDGRRAVSASTDNTLRVWDLESGQSLRTLEGHGDSVNGVAITADGARAVSASEDTTLRIWDLESGQSLRTLEGHSKSVSGSP
jgi:WD40 repeat protein